MADGPAVRHRARPLCAVPEEVSAVAGGSLRRRRAVPTSRSAEASISRSVRSAAASIAAAPCCGEAPVREWRAAWWRPGAASPGSGGTSRRPAQLPARRRASRGPDGGRPSATSRAVRTCAAELDEGRGGCASCYGVLDAPKAAPRASSRGSCAPPPADPVRRRRSIGVIAGGRRRPSCFTLSSPP